MKSLVAFMALGLAAAGPVPQAGYSAKIDHPYFPLSKVGSTVLEHTGKKGMLMNRKVEPKPQMVGGVACLVLVVEETTDGQPTEVTRHYFAQKDGTVFYFGEDVDNYKNGKIESHKGTWHVGKDTPQPFIFLPAKIARSDTWKPEGVKGVAEEEATAESVTESLTIAGVTYKDVLKIKKKDLLEGDSEMEYYAKEVGLIRVEDGADIFELKKAPKNAKLPD